ncbi:chromosome partition protein Smc-like [Palaemon carinicauda]|uniref:chromosome partition protein Smc-like n=1 Tax=Palaemon carinicauda TaxID=392227 RepID=UPI0035B657A9
MAAAAVIFVGIMLARRWMAREGVDNSSLEEYVPEMEHGCEELLDGIELKMETEDPTTLLKHLEAENDKLQGQIKEMERIVEICTEKDLQMKELEKLMENIRNENEKKTNLESECVEKDLQMKEHEKLMDLIGKENVVKKEQIEKNELVMELKKEVGELKAEKTKLVSECVEKDLQMKEHDKLMEFIRKENEVKKEQIKKNELVMELKKEVGELKAGKINWYMNASKKTFRGRNMKI